MSAAAVAVTASLALRIAQDERALLLARTGSAALQIMSVLLACAIFSDAGGIAATTGFMMLFERYSVTSRIKARLKTQ
jgi:hypothetical protein